LSKHKQGTLGPMSETWVMTGSQEDAFLEDTVQFHADEEQQLEDPWPDVDHRDGSSVLSRCLSQSQSQLSLSSAGLAPGQVEAEDFGEPKPEPELPLDCLPAHHNISSDTDEKSPRVSTSQYECSTQREEWQSEDVFVQNQPHDPGYASVPSPRSSGPCSDMLLTPPEPVEAHLGRSFFLPIYISLGLAVLSICLAVFAAYCCDLVEKDVSPANIMLMHSAKQLNLTEDVSKATIGELQDKLQLKQMQIGLDTQVFTAKREAAEDIIKSMCNLPEKICKSMVAAVGASDMKFHKKSSVPLDSNQGSYFGVWMWVKEMGGEGEVQVAFKAASLSYQLRDVVTYRDQVDDEPVIKCETLTNNFWFIQGREERCREVGRRKTITPLPVFKQSIMSPEEMQLVDTLMESMLAKKVLEDATIDIPQIPSAGAASHLASEGDHSRERDF